MLLRIIPKIIPKNQSFRKYTISNLNRLPYNHNAQTWNIISNTLVRSFTKLPKTPDLIYIPHIFRWLKTKFKFKYLQRTWDPDFTEGAFIYGTSKAVCRITEIIHQDRPEELESLLTSPAKVKLRQDMKTKFTKTQKAIIKLNPDDIKILVPVNIHLKNEGLDKLCRIAMRVLALKWVKPNTGPTRLVLVALQTEFMRNYKLEAVSEWTISVFDVLECVVLSSSPTYG